MSEFKRYLVFACWSDARGGLDDCIASFAVREDAEHAARESVQEYDWAQVFDCVKREVVLHCEREPYHWEKCDPGPAPKLTDVPSVCASMPGVYCEVVFSEHLKGAKV